MRRLLIFLIPLLFGLSSCTLLIDTAIIDYHRQADKIGLGATKEKVLSTFGSTQNILSPFYKKSPNSFMVDDVKVEILYFRSSRRPDGLTTSDEFTPYIFINDKLVAIGWPSLIGSNLSPQNRDITIRVDAKSGRMSYGFGNSWNNRNIFMGPYKHNSYGPGVHSDAAGKPFQWETRNGTKVYGPVRKDAYGLGIGMDQYGRPVKPGPWP